MLKRLIVVWCVEIQFIFFVSNFILAIETETVQLQQKNFNSNIAKIEKKKMSSEQFCLRWNNHHPNLIQVFSSLLQNDQMVDVTLISDDREIHAHKIVLSACSPFFQVNAE